MPLIAGFGMLIHTKSRRTEKVNLWWVALVAAVLHVGSFKLNDGIPWVGLASANLICANCVYFVAGVAFRRNEVRLWPLLDNKYVSAAVV